MKRNVRTKLGKKATISVVYPQEYIYSEKAGGTGDIRHLFAYSRNEPCVFFSTGLVRTFRDGTNCAHSSRHPSCQKPSIILVHMSLFWFTVSLTMVGCMKSSDSPDITFATLYVHRGMTLAVGEFHATRHCLA